VLAHLRDLDADFLAVYGIDLDVEEIGGPRFFALAHRAAAYQGVMAARVEAERDRQSGGAPDGREQGQAPPPTAGGGETREVSLTAFRVLFPGLVSMAAG
jgi:hypothetical protein